MNLRVPLLCAVLISLVACAASVDRSDTAQLQAQVTAAELAFAKTMADRDHAAFASFIAEEAVFISEANQYAAKRRLARTGKSSTTHHARRFRGSRIWLRFCRQVHSPIRLAPWQLRTEKSSRGSIRSGASKRRESGVSSLIAARQSVTVQSHNTDLTRCRRS